MLYSSRATLRADFPGLHLAGPGAHVGLSWFEVSPVLASPETLHLPGTRDDLGLQLLPHVGPWLGSS